MYQNNEKLRYAEGSEVIFQNRLTHYNDLLKLDIFILHKNIHDIIIIMLRNIIVT